MENTRFRLFRGGKEVRLERIQASRWKVCGSSPDTGFAVGDEVTPLRPLTWAEAKRRVNSDRSALSPMSLVLLRGEGQERSEAEIEELLRRRPWEPDPCPPAA